jgi:H+-transporting ATPase
MHEMLILSSWLGIAGVLSSFLFFYLLMVYLYHHPDTPLFMPMIPEWVDIKDPKSYLAFVQAVFFAKLVIAGHGTIYNTRIDDWFYKKPYPSAILFGATFSTRVIGTIIAVYGFGLMTPIGWSWGLFIWIYSIVWFIFNDAVKMAVIKYYRKTKGEEIL